MNTRAVLFLLMLCASFAAHGQQMTVITNAPLPPPHTYAELLDAAAEIYVDINNAGPDTDVWMKMSISRDGDTLIQTNETAAIGLCRPIPEGYSSFTIEQLGENLFAGGFNSTYFDFNGISPAQIETQQMLPGPAWTVCVQLFECNGTNALSSLLPNGCVTFPVAELPPPILTGICGSTRTELDGMLLVSWLYAPPPGYVDEINYNLRIVKIEPNDGREGDANDAMLSATEPYLYNVTHDATFANIEIPDELELEAGYRYAVQVQAFGVESDLPVQNQGLSEVCSFLYAPEGIGVDGLLRPIWPLNDNWYPFSFVPIISKFEPYREYTYFDWITTLNGNMTGEYPARDDHNAWPHSPIIDQSNSGYAVNEYQAQHLATYYNNATMPSGYSFNRGEHYQWRTVGDFTLGSSVYHGDTGNESFNIGMGPSQPVAPSDGANVEPGAIQLNWNTAEAPDPMLPPYDLFQGSGIAHVTEHNGWVIERWKLEVSMSSEFTEILYDTTGTLTGDALNLKSAIRDPAAFQNEMYKQLNATVTATDTGTYYWRLHWKIDPENLGSANYNTSPVYRFTIGGGETTTNEEEEEEEEEITTGGCLSNCTATAPTNTTAVSSLSAGANVKIGMFQMEILNAAGSSTFSGQGKIPVEFLNDAKIMVEFTGLRVNTDNEVFAGTITARKDWTPASLAMVSSGARMIPSIDSSDAVLMNGFIEDGARLVSLLTSGSEVGLPIGIDREISGRQVTVGIINMVFTPTQAHLDMVAGIEISEVPTMLAFGVGDMCFAPTGLGNEGRAYLAADIDIPFNGNTFTFKGGASTDTTNITYLDWNCNGFKCMQLAAGMKFSRDNIIPPGDTASASTNKVEARFKMYICTDWDFMAEFTMDPFEARGAPGWSFTVEEAWVDLSSRSNPQAIVFPPGYDHPDIVGGAATANLWTGFYLKRLALASPAALTGEGGDPFTASVNNFIIDDLGLTFNFALTNLLSTEAGNLAGCSFSMDSLYMDVMKSSFRAAGLKGEIGLPIAGENDHLDYLAVFGAEDDNGDGDTEWGLALEVNVDQGITFPAWVATVDLKPNTLIRARLSSASKVHLELNATVSITDGNDAGDSGNGLSMPGIDITNLIYDTETGYQCNGCFALSSPDKKMSGFPLTIEDFGLDLERGPENPGLFIEPMITIGSGKASLSGGTRLTFFVNTETGSSGIKRVSFESVAVNNIHLGTDMNGIKLEGNISWTNEPTKKEFRGDLTVGLPMGIKGSLMSIFGVKRTDPTAPFNTAQNYPYWMIDGQVYIPGLTLFPGLDLIGFGGGVYHHMRMTNPDALPGAEALLTLPEGTKEGEGEDVAVHNIAQRSSANYVEDYSIMLGLRLGLALGCTGNTSTYNMDVNLDAVFATEGGITRLALTGDLYALADIDEREDAPITAHVLIAFEKKTTGPVFDGQFALMVNFNDWIYGAQEPDKKMVDAKIHTEPGGWYFQMGRPEPGQRGGIKVDLSILKVTLDNYVMAGNMNMPMNIPAPPEWISAILNGTTGDALGQSSATNETLSAEPSTQLGTTSSGKGFAFGASLDLQVDIPAVFVYAKFRLGLGFDVNYTKHEGIVCANIMNDDGTPMRPGNNGWYFKGQMYAAMEGEIGVQIPLIFTNIRVPIIKAGAAMLLQGNGPKPFGFKGQAGLYYEALGGAISGRATFEVTKGNYCIFMTDGDPLENIKFIEELGPKGNDVSIFKFPHAGFLFPLDTKLELPKAEDPETGEIWVYQFYPYAAEFTLKQLDPVVNIPGSKNRLEDGYQMALVRNDVMKAQTEHQTYIKVMVKEKVDGVMHDFIDPDTHQKWFEDKTSNFKTGDAPPTITAEDVAFTYPANRQRFYLQDESEQHGMLKFEPGHGRSDLFFASDATHSYTYHARFVSLNGDLDSETDVSYTGSGKLLLDLPRFENSATYKCQIIRRKLRNMQDQVTDLGASANRNIFAPGSPNYSQTITNNVGDYLQVLSGRGSVTDPTELPARTTQLYEFTFRTSTYNTLADKVADLELSARYPSQLNEPHSADVMGRMDERFDKVDYYGVKKGAEPKMGQLVKFSPKFSDDYYKYVNDFIYSRYIRYTSNPNYSITYSLLPTGFTMTSILGLTPPTEKTVQVNFSGVPFVHPWLWSSNDPNLRLFEYYTYPSELLSNSEMEPTMTIVGGSTSGNTLVASVGTIPYGNIAGAGSGYGTSFGSSGGLFGSQISAGAGGALASANTSPNLYFSYIPQRKVTSDLNVMRNYTTTMMNRPVNTFRYRVQNGQPVVYNGQPLLDQVQRRFVDLLPLYPVQGLNFDMQYIVGQAIYNATLLHSGNLPTPNSEFPVSYTNDYTMIVRYQLPQGLGFSGGTSRVEKQFSINHETPTNGGNGPY